MTSTPNQPIYHWTANICDTGLPTQPTKLAWTSVLEVSGQGSRKPSCHQELSLEAAHHRKDREKTRAYDEMIQHVDEGSFTPLVFTTSENKLI